MEPQAYTGPESSRGAESLALSETAAARVLGISPRKLWSLRKQNRVPFVRIDKAVRYPVHLLRRWLEEQALHAAASSERFERPRVSRKSPRQGRAEEVATNG